MEFWCFPLFHTTLNETVWVSSLLLRENTQSDSITLERSDSFLNFTDRMSNLLSKKIPGRMIPIVKGVATHSLTTDTILTLTVWKAPMVEPLASLNTI